MNRTNQKYLYPNNIIYYQDINGLKTVEFNAIAFNCTVFTTKSYFFKNSADSTVKISAEVDGLISRDTDCQKDIVS